MTIYISSPITFQKKVTSGEFPSLFLNQEYLIFFPQQFMMVDYLAPLTLQAGFITY